jgi:hypothetical protein
MDNVIVGRVNPRSAIFGRAVANLTSQDFGSPFLKYERVLMPGDPPAANLVEPVSRH